MLGVEDDRKSRQQYEASMSGNLLEVSVKRAHFRAALRMLLANDQEPAEGHKLISDSMR